MDKVKLLREYENLIERLYKAEEWLSVSKYNTWEEVGKNKFDIYNRYKEIMKEIRLMHKEMIKVGLIKGLGEATN